MITECENSVLVECCGCGSIEVLKNESPEGSEGWKELELVTDMGVSHIGYCPDCWYEAFEQRGDMPEYKLDFGTEDEDDGQENGSGA